MTRGFSRESQRAGDAICHLWVGCLTHIHQVVLLDCFLLSPQFESCPNSSSPDRSRQSQGDSIVTAQQPRINQDHPMARGKLFLPKIAESDPPPPEGVPPAATREKPILPPTEVRGIIKASASKRQHVHVCGCCQPFSQPNTPLPARILP